jgi:drug/metabolite transporter, DME family
MFSAHQKGMLAVLLGATVWSTGGLCIKLLPFDPYTILFYRSLFAGLVFLTFYRRRALILTPVVFGVGVLYAGLATCFIVATKMTTAANAVFLQYTAPVYLFLLEPWLFKFKLSRLNIITAAVCIFGMLLFFQGDLGSENLLGSLIGLFSGVLLAAMLLLQRFNKQEHYGAGLVWGNVFIMLICSPWFMASASPEPLHWLLFVVLGAFQIGLGYLLFNYGLQRTRAVESSLLAMMEPIFNPVWVYLGYGEQPGPWAIVGGLIIVGMLAVQVVLSAKKVEEVRGE